MATGQRRESDNENEEQRLAKRIKVDPEPRLATLLQEPLQDVEMETGQGGYPSEDLLPPSRSLLPYKRPESTEDEVFRILEPDVGISEYIAKDVPMISGIIKQRFTDFLVFEVDLQGDVVHLKSLDRPKSNQPLASVNSLETSEKTSINPVEPSEQIPAAITTSSRPLDDIPAQDDLTVHLVTPEENGKFPAQKQRNLNTTMGTSEEDNEPWPARFTEILSPLLSATVIENLKAMFLQGPEPPFVSDSGWDGKKTELTAEETAPTKSLISDTQDKQPALEGNSRGKKLKQKGGRGRKERSGGREDNRRVISEPIPSKQDRTALHEAIRDLFKGNLESETDKNSDAGQRIVIKWSKSKASSAKRGGKQDAISRGKLIIFWGRNNPFPYVHFTMQKTNRDTQDAISHISRLLHVNVKDLSVAGTKDKRGVTTQRVSLKRNGRTIGDVWNVVNGLTGRRSYEQAITERGERGIRITDLSYRKSPLELGTLRGNAFVITLRNVRVESMETMDRALNSLKENGFINYYGMQRFGTASIPTHSIGLALLRSDWTGAVSLIMRPRPGEYADAEAARRAWLEERDLDKALSLMPRRVVAERCILESYQKQKGDDRNALGAISTIPRNLRLMYIHAYQSYVWNAIVSERIQKYGQKPIVGDLVFVLNDECNEEGSEPLAETEDPQGAVNDEVPESEKASVSRKEKKSWQPPRVKVLTAEDLHKYSIFDVIMPLPGTDVAYPEGPLGEKYRDFLRLDGLDPDNFNRKQKDYTLGGSYRKILHLPKHLSWSVMRYTDPDVPLAQSDEDELLGFDPVLTDTDGPFMALQIRLQLGTAAYATMALREVTKTETSSHHQSSLTQASDDQRYRGTGDVDVS